MTGISKEYIVPDPGANKVSKIRKILWKPTKKFLAIDDISFNISEGDAVGLVGHNGSGKSTIVKMLSGILSPTKGVVNVMGFSPIERKNEFLSQIGVMMGQRSMLFYDLPIEDSFNFFRKIYDATSDEYRVMVDELIEKIGLNTLLKTPVRKLSLGQRMKAEIILSIIHKPKVLFLDEPTIGLDFGSKKEILSFIKTLNQEYGVIVLLTSHDLDDIDSICNKLILIESGKIQYQGDINKIGSRNEYRLIDVQGEILEDLKDVLVGIGCRVSEPRSGQLRIIAKNEALNACIDILRQFNIDNVSVNRPNLEFVLSSLNESE